MEFEPFHSDDEDDTTFMPEKKRRDGSDKKKKAKSGPLFRSDKKDKNVFNDLHSPSGVKQKHSVHGVVGPADYIFDHGGSPPPADTPTVETNTQGSVQQTHSVSLQNLNQVNINTVSQPTSSWSSQQLLQQPVHQQPATQLPKPSIPKQPVQSFQPNFPPTTTISTKIERPHSSAALLQERQSPQTPTPFKQPNSATPQKATLLAQAMGSNYTQSGSPGNLTHQRNHSYSRAMSVPILNRPEVNGAQFQAKFDASEHEFSTSPIPEVTTPTRTDSASTPPLTPSATAQKEFWTNDVEKPTVTANEQFETEWANFSSSSLPQEKDNDYTISRRQSHGGESLPESVPDSVPDSTSSVDDDIDDSVWRINEEQREYYTNQFINLQPNTADVIKGPQARDFFLKSNLPTETLSKIWHLSDLDKDFALNLEEFYIAMHLVVAVRHGVDLPHVLPSTLLPKEEVEPYEAIEPIVNEEDENHSDSTVDEKFDQPSEWAFDFDKVDAGGMSQHVTSTEHLSKHTDTVQTLGQSSPKSVTAIPMESRIQPVSSESNNFSSQLSSSVECLQLAPSEATSPQLKQEGTSSTKDTNLPKTAIARPRASANKNVNLMDASPWQLLPPPAKSKQPAKKSLSLGGELGSDSALDSSASAEDVATLVSIDRYHVEDVKGVKPFPTDDSDESPDESERLKVTIKSFHKNLAKEKSRSIDSLRSDISESGEFSWKRQSLRRDSRPRSFTGSSTNESNSQETNVKEFEIPPIPPPRNKGHARASSLDLNKLFGAKSSQSTSEIKVRYSSASSENATKSEPPQKPPRVSAPVKIIKSTDLTSSADTFHICPPPPALRESLNAGNKNRNRSFSLESNLLLDSGMKPDGLVARTNEAQRKRLKSADTAEININSNKPGSPKLNKHGVRFSEQTEVLNQTKSPVEKRMRKNELQASIRSLRDKNRILESLNCQLDVEFKKVSEERTMLDERLRKLEQQ